MEREPRERSEIARGAAGSATPEDPSRSAKGEGGRLGAIFLTVFMDLLGFGLVMPLLPRYAQTLHASPFQIGLLGASYSAMQFVFVPVWGRLSDRVGRR